jgi:hypothetical protein
MVTEFRLHLFSSYEEKSLLAFLFKNLAWTQQSHQKIAVQVPARRLGEASESTLSLSVSLGGGYSTPI